MIYKTLGKTDLRVSQGCVGTMTFGDQLNQEQVNQCVAYALEMGINFIDTANIYPRTCPGLSEEYLGNALQGCRNRVILATKAGGSMKPGPNDGGLKKERLIQAVEGSLKRLQTDYLDILYAHFPDKEVSSEELVVGMGELIKSGKIRYYGLSNFPAWRVCEISLLARSMGLPEPIVNESVYNLLTRGVEEELLPCLNSFGQGFVVYNPLAGGILTGKYRECQMISGTRFALEKGYADRYWSQENLHASIELEQIAGGCGLGLIELALGWLSKQGVVSSVILGFSKMEQLKSNIAALEKAAEMDLPVEQLDGIWNALKGTRFRYHK